MDQRNYHIIIMAVVFIAAMAISLSFLGIGPRQATLEGIGPVGFAAPAIAQEPIPPSGLTITPNEIDFGQLGPWGTRRATVSLKKTVSGSVAWSLVVPAGWKATDENVVIGILEEDSESMHIQLRILQKIPERKGNNDRNNQGKKQESGERKEQNGQNGQKERGGLNDRNGHNGGMGQQQKTIYAAQLLFEAGNQYAEFTREIEPGQHHVRVRMEADGGPASLDIHFKLPDMQAQPLLSVNPGRIDFGAAVRGETVNRRVRVTNEGWETLRWRASTAKKTALDPAAIPYAGKYVSFLNDETAGTSRYKIPRHLKDTLELPDKWSENQGYPCASEDGHALRFHFTGTGIAVYFWKGPTAGQLTAFIDDRFIGQQDGVAEERERFEWLVAEELSGGPHVMTLVNRNGPAVIEGVRIFGGALMPLNPTSLSVSPDHGAVTRQTNYVNIAVNTRTLSPGQYSGQIVFNSNGGQQEVELSLDVTADNIPRTLAVYRFVRDTDYFLTANPHAESTILHQRGYTNQGIVFRLFSAGTPGTTEFYRWLHPQNGSHFYGYDLKITRRPMQGYVLEGAIGNIATSRLSHTRELYRWYHASSGHYFYTIDPKGEGIDKKGYRFDGIAGYVKQ